MDRDKLTEIMENKRCEVAQRVRPVGDSELARLGEMRRTGPSFYDALKNPAHLSVIAEIKRKSPSAGEIKALPDASEQARRYYNAGTDAISVLTDEKYFGGSIRDLWDVTDLLGGRDDAPPVIRKDFFVHPVQVAEAAEAGARAILIIVRAISDEEAKALRRAADIAGLDSLYEIHSESDLERALAMKARIVGVNNRDLTRFVTDLAYSEKLLPLVPKGIVKVSESGIHTPEDAARARAAGADAVLVGESLMRSEDPERLLAAFQQA
jgi:indole-3-glycerol phosphate synthase